MSSTLTKRLSLEPGETVVGVARCYRVPSAPMRVATYALFALGILPGLILYTFAWRPTYLVATTTRLHRWHGSAVTGFLWFHSTLPLTALARSRVDGSGSTRTWSFEVEGREHAWSGISWGAGIPKADAQAFHGFLAALP
jgi:hypothetical protein